MKIDFPNRIKKILITGGAGFIGGSVIRKFLKETSVEIYNLDKMGYASNLKGIEETINELGDKSKKKHHLINIDLNEKDKVNEAIKFIDPDLIMHLAAESHVDRSIENPSGFIKSNIIGTFNLLEAARNHWEKMIPERKEFFRFHHISTDEVFGSLGIKGFFKETTAYDPRSPYSASKASSDHLVNAWYHTYGLPIVISNCSNNYGPWQFPEKLIPVVILKALKMQNIPLYGDGLNIRDWLFVDDHAEALILTASRGLIGNSYCIGSRNERTNIEVVTTICEIMDQKFPNNSPHSRLIKQVKDRPGHDKRYAIDPSKIYQELKWRPQFEFEKGIKYTVDWYSKNQEWCTNILDNSK